MAFFSEEKVSHAESDIGKIGIKKVYKILQKLKLTKKNKAFQTVVVKT